jgi:hypothetical protein
VSKNKSYNSILFLTTLSVYLGLVLVGVSPSVLAHQAALSSKFEIQNEFEAEEDLDKNPEDEGLEQYFLVRLDNALNTFVEDLRKLNSKRRYKFRGNEDIIAGCQHTFCSGNIVDATSSFVDSWIANEFENLRRNLDIGADRDYTQVPKFVSELKDKNGNISCKDFGLEFSINKSTFQTKISFTQNSSPQALATANNLNALFANKAAVSQNTATRRFYEHTRAKTENNQVLVVTRLPRGSLDALVRSKK